MNLYEAVGVIDRNIDKRTGKELGHREIYSRMIEYLGGLDTVAVYLPYDLKYLEKHLRMDENLNNTRSESDWDRMAGFVNKGNVCEPIGGGLFNLYRRRGVSTVSNATGVFILKEAARQIVERKWRGDEARREARRKKAEERAAKHGGEVADSMSA